MHLSKEDTIVLVSVVNEVSAMSPSVRHEFDQVDAERQQRSELQVRQRT